MAGLQCRQRLWCAVHEPTALELGGAWHDGTGELVFERLEFLKRLAAMTPRPETNLLTCHGVVAPRARWCARVVVCGRVAPDLRYGHGYLEAVRDELALSPTTGAGVVREAPS